MRVEIIDRYSKLCELEADWNELLTSSGENCVFLTFEWFSSFVRSFELEDRLAVGIVREGSEVVGILPLYKAHTKVAGVTCKALRSISNVHTPKYDFIFKLGKEESVQRVLSELREYYKWDLVELDYVNSYSSVLKALCGNSSGGHNFRTVPVMKSPFLETTGGWEEYYNSLSKKLNKNMDYYERRASREFGVEMEVINGPLLDRDVLLEAFRIEDSGWKGTQGSSIIKNDKVSDFYRDLALSMNRKGWFDLLFLKFGEARVAFDYCLKYDSSYSLLKIGYDEKYGKYSPGMILRKMAIKNVFQQGFRRYDFLGGNDEYKVKMSNRDAIMSRVFIFGGGVKSNLIKTVLFGAPQIAEKMKVKGFVKKFGLRFGLLGKSKPGM